MTLTPNHSLPGNEPPMDPFHTLVTRGWAIDLSPTHPPYVPTLGVWNLILRHYDERGATTRTFYMYGDDADDLMTRAADIALRIERGRTLPGKDTFIKDRWMA